MRRAYPIPAPKHMKIRSEEYGLQETVVEPQIWHVANFRYLAFTPGPSLSTQTPVTKI